MINGLEVHVRKPCEKCGGTGREAVESERPKGGLSCLHCGAKGYFDEWIALPKIVAEVASAAILKFFEGETS